MWVVGYDPADTNDLLAGGLEHWLRRHGSPFHPDSHDFVAAHWIPITSIPGLTDLATSSDFILIHAPGIEHLRRHKIWTTTDPPDYQIRNVMNAIGPENALLSIEFTYNMDFGSNVIQRTPNMIYPATKGLPSFVVVPEVGYALREVGRLGDGSEKQRKLQAATERPCRSLVHQNREVTLESVEEILGRSLEYDAENKMGYKVPLLMSVIGDTWGAPAGVLPLPPCVTFFPNKWKMSGCQLSIAYDMIRAAMEIWVSGGRRLNHEDDVIVNNRSSAEQLLAYLGVNMRKGPRNRNVDWDDRCSRTGFPPQSRADFSRKSISEGGEYVTENHHSLYSPELTTIDSFDTSDSDAWNKWVSIVAKERTGGGRVLHNRNIQKRLKFLRERGFSTFQVDLLPDEIKSRGCLATLNIGDYATGKPKPLYHNILERTYAGRAMCMDLINFRTYAGTSTRPRKVEGKRTARDVIFAVDLPIDSSDFERLAKTRTQVNEWYKMADIYILEDGVFLGRLWTRDRLLKLA